MSKRTTVLPGFVPEEEIPEEETDSFENPRKLSKFPSKSITKSNLDSKSASMNPRGAAFSWVLGSSIARRATLKTQDTLETKGLGHLSYVFSSHELVVSPCFLFTFCILIPLRFFFLEVSIPHIFHFEEYRYEVTAAYDSSKEHDKRSLNYFSNVYKNNVLGQALGVFLPNTLNFTFVERLVNTSRYILFALSCGSIVILLQMHVHGYDANFEVVKKKVLYPYLLVYISILMLLWIILNFLKITISISVAFIMFTIGMGMISMFTITSEENRKKITQDLQSNRGYMIVSISVLLFFIAMFSTFHLQNESFIWAIICVSLVLITNLLNIIVIILMSKSYNKEIDIEKDTIHYTVLPILAYAAVHIPRLGQETSNIFSSYSIRIWSVQIFSSVVFQPLLHKFSQETVVSQNIQDCGLPLLFLFPLQMTVSIFSAYQIFLMNMNTYEYYTSAIGITLLEFFRDTYFWHYVMRFVTQYTRLWNDLDEIEYRQKILIMNLQSGVVEVLGGLVLVGLLCGERLYVILTGSGEGGIVIKDLNQVEYTVDIALLTYERPDANDSFCSVPNEGPRLQIMSTTVFFKHMVGLMIFICIEYVQKWFAEREMSKPRYIDTYGVPTDNFDGTGYEYLQVIKELHFRRIPFFLFFATIGATFMSIENMAPRMCEII